MSLYAPIKIILADDHELYRDGFTAMLKTLNDIELIGEAKDGEELVKIARRLQPDIVVTDILMPVMSGIEATKILLKELPQIGVIALSMSNQENLVMQMIEAGAQGYLLKNAYKDEIIEAIKTVHKGNNYYCKNTTTKLTHLLSQRNYISSGQQKRLIFSEKELAIIRLICRERSSQEIAGELGLSIRTIDSYRKNILKKMKVKNVTGIVMYAIRHSIYCPDDIV